MADAPSILLADEDEPTRSSVSECLAEEGYEVHTAGSCEEAIARIASLQPDVAILDLPPGDTDGLAILERAQLARPETAFVLTSSRATVGLAVRAMRLGASDFLVKPFQEDAMLESVDRALRARRPRRESAAAARSKPGGLASIIGMSPAIAELRHTIAAVAASDTATVLIEGESGTGKDLVAHAIHLEGPRAGEPYVHLNCAALPPYLVESELFGHERGAFTDAHMRKAGLFEQAGSGIVFLDEIGELSPTSQAKFLQLLENRTFRRVGGTDALRCSARVIAATNSDLDAAVAKGHFRVDLFYRLAIIRIRVPSLRERIEDVPRLAAHFLARLACQNQIATSGISPRAVDAMLAYHWPGNVRELRNAIECAVTLHPRLHELQLEHLPHVIRAAALAKPTQAANEDGRRGTEEGADELKLDLAERSLIAQVLERCRGNQSQAARLLGVSRYTLRYRIRKHRLA